VTDDAAIGGWTVYDHAYLLDDCKSALYRINYDDSIAECPMYRPFVGTQKKSSFRSKDHTLVYFEGNAKIEVDNTDVGADGLYLPVYIPTGVEINADDEISGVTGWASSYPDETRLVSGGAVFSSDIAWPDLWRTGWWQAERDNSNYRSVQWIARTTDATFKITGGTESVFNLSVPHDDFYEHSFEPVWEPWDYAYPFYRNSKLKMLKYGAGVESRAILVKLPEPYGADMWDAWTYNSADGGYWFDRQIGEFDPRTVSSRVRSNLQLRVVSVPRLLGSAVVYDEQYGIVPEDSKEASLVAYDDAPEEAAGSYTVDLIYPPADWDGIASIESNAFYRLVSPTSEFDIELDGGLYASTNTAILRWSANYGMGYLAAYEIESLDPAAEHISGPFKPIDFRWNLEHTNSNWQIIDAYTAGKLPVSFSGYEKHATFAAYDAAYPLPALEISSANETNLSNLVDIQLTSTNTFLSTDNAGPLTSDAFLEITVNGVTRPWSLESSGGGLISIAVPDIPITPDDTGTVATEITARLVRIIVDSALDGTVHRQEGPEASIELYTTSDTSHASPTPPAGDEAAVAGLGTPTTSYAAHAIVATLTPNVQVNAWGELFPHSTRIPITPADAIGDVEAVDWLPYVGGSVTLTKEVLQSAKPESLYVPELITAVLPPGKYIGSAPLKLRNPSEARLFLYTPSGFSNYESNIVDISAESCTVDNMEGPNFSFCTELVSSSLEPVTTNGITLSTGDSIDTIYDWYHRDEFSVFGPAQDGDTINDHNVLAKAYLYPFIYENDSPGKLDGVYLPVRPGEDVTGFYELTTPRWLRSPSPGNELIADGIYTPTEESMGEISVAIMNHKRYTGDNPDEGYDFKQIYHGYGDSGLEIANITGEEEISISTEGMAVTKTAADGPEDFWPGSVEMIPKGTVRTVLKIRESESPAGLSHYPWTIVVWEEFEWDQDAQRHLSTEERHVTDHFGLKDEIDNAGYEADALSETEEMTNVVFRTAFASGGGEYTTTSVNIDPDTGDFNFIVTVHFTEHMDLPSKVELDPFGDRPDGRLDPPAATEWVQVNYFRESGAPFIPPTYVRGNSEDILEESIDALEIRVGEGGGRYLSGFEAAMQSFFYTFNLGTDPTIEAADPEETDDSGTNTYWAVVGSFGISADIYTALDAVNVINHRTEAADYDVLGRDIIVDFEFSDAPKPTEPQPYDDAIEAGDYTPGTIYPE